jgi:hypothetical protein
LREAEPILIKQFNAHYRDGFGYNMTKGGDGSTGYKYNEEQKNKLRYKRTAEHKAKIGAAQVGRKRSDETRNRMAQAKQKRWRVTHPDGHVEEIVNLRQYVKPLGLSTGNLITHGHSKGFKVERLDN